MDKGFRVYRKAPYGRGRADVIIIIIIIIRAKLCSERVQWS